MTCNNSSVIYLHMLYCIVCFNIIYCKTYFYIMYQHGWLANINSNWVELHVKKKFVPSMFFFCVCVFFFVFFCYKQVLLYCNEKKVLICCSWFVVYWPLHGTYTKQKLTSTHTQKLRRHAIFVCVSQPIVSYSFNRERCLTSE